MRILEKLVVWFSLVMSSTAAFAVGLDLSVLTKPSAASVITSAFPTADYIDNGDGTVTHKITGLTWKRCAEGQNWTGATCGGAAQAYPWAAVTGLVTNGWRLPSVEQLLTIVEMGHGSPTINPVVFPNTPAYDFWTDSPYDSYSGYAWVVGFYNGIANHNVLYSRGNIGLRLVRGTQTDGGASSTIASLSGLTLRCSSELVAGGSGSCTVTASYSDNTSKAVTPVWTSSGTQATINDKGVLMANAGLAADTGVTITASYTENGVTKTAQYKVTIKAALATTSPTSDTPPASSITTPANLNGVEFHNAINNRYFWTADSAEIAGIERGEAGPGWDKTGGGWTLWDKTAAPAEAKPVCRFRGNPAIGNASHFFTVDQNECDYVKKNDSAWIYEGIASYAVPPTGGACPSDLAPLARAYNVALANHRYMNAKDKESTYLDSSSKGWKLESVSLCVGSAKSLDGSASTGSTTTSTGTSSTGASSSGTSSTSTSSSTSTATKGAPVVSLTPTSLTFSPLVVFDGKNALTVTSAAQTLILRNTGDAVLELAGGDKGIIVSLSPAAKFNVTQNCGNTMAPGGSCTISVTLTASANDGLLTDAVVIPGNMKQPPKSIPPQPLSGTLEIRSNAVPSSTIVKLSGTAIYNTTPTCTSTEVLVDGMCVQSLTGTWKGTWQWSGPGSTGCIHSDGGAFTMTLTQSGRSFSGSTYGEGVQWRNSGTCKLTETVSESGSISGTTTTSGASLSFSLNTMNFSGTATRNGLLGGGSNILTGTFTRTTGGQGTFTVTKQ
ncbi:MAG: DUF1566 domain-containing protein [Sulfuricella sp.]|nr:DUF1566 domain-containing protein [Sulfuricella sp.]